jgi:Protein of unknown function (DUF3124)
MRTRIAAPAGRRSIAACALVALAGISCGGTGPEPSRDTFRPGSSRIGISEVVAPPDDKILAGQSIYVPIYPYVFTADNAEPLNLAATLYVRNTDPSHSIIVTKVSYYHSGGKSLRDYLTGPIKLDSRASVDFFVKESDLSGGPSPSFVVEWASTETASDPVVEAVMIGTSGTQGISFTCPGRVIRSRKP